MYSMGALFLAGAVGLIVVGGVVAFISSKNK